MTYFPEKRANMSSSRSSRNAINGQHGQRGGKKMEEREVYKNLAEKTGDSLEAIYRLPNAEREELLEVFQLSGIELC